MYVVNVCMFLYGGMRGVRCVCAYVLYVYIVVFVCNVCAYVCMYVCMCLCLRRAFAYYVMYERL